MNLKTSIIVVNEFSVPLPGGGGSRGGTPGRYVERYMARAGATETVAPIRFLRNDDYIMRYMARESAVEHAANPQDAKDEMSEAQGQGGVAFGYGSVSMSDEELKIASADIQALFEQGHTVMKTVLSFDEEYLRARGIIDQDFHCVQAGDYRGNIDQMKLRLGIMRGLERMSGVGYDDLRYVGVIQVDTEHVHFHGCMVDAGGGQIVKDGTQRGKLLDKHKSRLRRGIDSFLDEKQQVAQLSSAVGYERRNVTTFIKRWAHQQMAQEALPQFMMACLPEDQKLWRAGTNHHSMRKANALVTELVSEQLARPDSPLPVAMDKIHEYANKRRDDENLSVEKWQKLIDEGREQITERAVNGVYQMLRSLPKEQLVVSTPMLDVMSMDYEQLAEMALDQHEVDADSEDDLVSFGFRLRRYSARLSDHRVKTTEYTDLKGQWEKADAAGNASDDSRPLHDFYAFEAEYQRQLLAKYQHFLPFAGEEEEWDERVRTVVEYGQKLQALTLLRNDASLQRMKEGNEAESLGRLIYGQPGGRLMTQGKDGRQILDNRLGSMTSSYDQQLAQLKHDLSLAGLSLQLVEDDVATVQELMTLPVEVDAEAPDQQVPVTGQVLSAAAASALPTDGDSVREPLNSTYAFGPGAKMRVGREAPYAFNDVKSLDLHHLDYDFFTDVKVGPKSRQTFTSVAENRRRLLVKAMDYLDRSGQASSIKDLPVDDVAAMGRMSQHLHDTTDERGESVLPSRFARLRERADAGKATRQQAKRSKATRLDDRLMAKLQMTVDAAIEKEREERAAQPAPGPDRGPSY